MNDRIPPKLSPLDDVTWLTLLAAAVGLLVGVLSCAIGEWLS